MNRSNAVPSGIFQPQTLDVDENIFDKNLRIIDDGLDQSELSAVPSIRPHHQPTLLPEPELPSITVVPDSGMCVKTKNFEGKTDTLRQKSSNYPKIHISKISFFDKTHIFKISFLTKFTFSKSHF